MLKKLSIITLMMLLTVSTVFAYDVADKASCIVNKENSAFFVDDNGGKYVTLVEVTPETGKMHIRFFDTKGKEVMIRGVKEITGRAILYDGTRRDVTFTSEQVLKDELYVFLESSGYEAEEAWIRYTNGFSLVMEIPVDNDAFELAYSYGCSNPENKELAMISVR